MTIAPEKFKHTDNVEYLAQKGIILSIGHSNCSYEDAKECIEKGATSSTHLYNAMSGIVGREPGIIGAILNTDIFASVIPDLHHVHPANIEIASKLKEDKLFIVTDCHAPAGTELKEFELHGLHMYVKNGLCCDKEGKLSGSNILMNEGVKNCVNSCNIKLEKAL